MKKRHCHTPATTIRPRADHLEEVIAAQAGFAERLADEMNIAGLGHVPIEAVEILDCLAFARLRLFRDENGAAAAAYSEQIASARRA